ncbi:MAG: RDD family protein [Acidobacteria bacterium]|nr:RDD family protein [Acidobacteriota bacterium]
MVNDTAREEAETSITRLSGPLTVPAAVAAELEQETAHPIQSSVSAAVTVATVVPKRVGTSDLPPKCTSPTLVDFQPKHTMLPDWRLQLQNSVRMRSTGGVRELALAGNESRQDESEPKITRTTTASKDASANANDTEQAAKNPMVANALRRIEESRKAYLPDKETRPSAAPQRNYPFNVVSRTEPPVAVPVSMPVAPPVSVQKPKLVSSLRIEKRAYDTNKLPPIARVTETDPVMPVIENAPVEVPNPAEVEILHSTETVIAEVRPAEAENILEAAENETTHEIAEEYDDLAPFSMRFAAGLFDVVIGAIGSLIIVSPFIAGGTWLSVSGVLAFTALLGIFLFLYLTASISLWGGSFGMRIFSLELIDADDSSTPTVHQAAVHSAVYILSLAFLGAGFLTVLFNEEKRAVHDLVSGTLVIREHQ